MIVIVDGQELDIPDNQWSRTRPSDQAGKETIRTMTPQGERWAQVPTSDVAGRAWHDPLGLADVDLWGPIASVLGLRK